MKFDLTSENINQKFTDKNLSIQKGWVKRGEYFYYTKKAEAYTDYLVVDGVQIPDTELINKQDNEASVTISVYGEAIQSDSITPDFSSENPWNGKKPEHSTNTSEISHPQNSRTDSILSIFISTGNRNCIHRKLEID